MKRNVIVIDEELCNGCGACAEGCHEGAIQMVDGKARLISELYCDGLGACIGECPINAITLVEQESVEYDEIATLERMLPKGMNTVAAHLDHLDHMNAIDWLRQGLEYLASKQIDGYKLLANFRTKKQEQKMAAAKVLAQPINQASNGNHHHHGGGGCPGSAARNLKTEQTATPKATSANVASQLENWPIQLHLLSPEAPYLKGEHLLLAADCTAFALGAFHNKVLAGKKLAIACPKLDSNQEVYKAKLEAMLTKSNISALTIAIMEVPCCRGLAQMAIAAIENTGAQIPVEIMVVGIDGKSLNTQIIQ